MDSPCVTRLLPRRQEGILVRSTDETQKDYHEIALLGPRGWLVPGMRYGPFSCMLTRADYAHRSRAVVPPKLRQLLDGVIILRQRQENSVTGSPTLISQGQKSALDGLVGVNAMTLSRLKWLSVLAPAVLVTLFETGRHLVLDEHSPAHLPAWAGSFVVLLAISAGAFAFSRAIFGAVEKMQREIMRQNQEILRRNQDLSARNAVGVAVSQATNLDDALGLALDTVLQITGAESGEILVLEEESQRLVVHAHRGIEAEAFEEITSFKLGEGLPGLVAQSREPVLVHDLPHDPRFIRKKVIACGFRSFAGVPLRSKNQVVGVMEVASLDSHRITDDSLVLLTAIGNQIGVVIENARLTEQIRYLATLEERDRIGREMHDSFAQTLGYLNMQSRAIEFLFRNGEHEQALAELRQMGEGVRGAFNDVREAIFNLRTSVAQESDLTAILQEHLLEFGRSCGITVSLEAPQGQELRLPPCAQVQMVCIVQEALTNVRKHAGASQVTVRLGRQNGRVSVSVEDNGCGFDTQVLGNGGLRNFGLSIMKERAEAAGGRFSVQSGPRQGTVVHVELPGRKGG